MVTEKYVSSETARLLEEKGFDWDCRTRKYFPKTNYDEECPNGCYAPTQQTAMDWLRTVHNIYVEVRITNHSISELVNIPKYYWILFDVAKVKWLDESTAHSIETSAFDKPEDAREDAIRHCLKKMI